MNFLQGRLPELHNNNSNNILYSSQQEIKAVVRSHNEEHIISISYETHTHTHSYSQTCIHPLKLQALVYDILPSTTAIFSYTIGSRKLSANEQLFFFVGAQTVVLQAVLLQATPIISDVCFITDHVAMSAQIKPQSFELRQNSFFTRGGCASCLRVCLGARLLLQTYQYPKLSEGADRVGGQLRGDKECPFSGVTESGRVWRKVPESSAWSVTPPFSQSACTNSKPKITWNNALSVKPKCKNSQIK